MQKQEQADDREPGPQVFRFRIGNFPPKSGSGLFSFCFTLSVLLFILARWPEHQLTAFEHARKN